MNPEAFSDLASARHSVRDFRPDPVPGEVLDAILDDARQAPSWSNTRPFMVALATGERADRLRAAYVAEFDATLPVQHKERGAMARLVLSGRAPDGDYRTWAPYPAELLPHSQAVGGRLYAHMGIARQDREARDAAARRRRRAARLVTARPSHERVGTRRTGRRSARKSLTGASDAYPRAKPVMRR